MFWQRQLYAFTSIVDYVYTLQAMSIIARAHKLLSWQVEFVGVVKSTYYKEGACFACSLLVRESRSKIYNIVVAGIV